MKVKLSELHLWDKNPRIIKDKRFESLCQSLKDDPEYMELRPILATKDGRIYAGNMRYRAAQKLGWEEVDAVLTDIPEKLANERAIKDNNEFGEWNNDELATLLDEMEKAGTDLDTLGLDQAIEDIIKQLEPEIEEDTVPEPKKDPQTVLGDLWQLGEHRLLCGDATNIEHVERLMDGENADMVFTSPPYGAAKSAKLRDHYVKGAEKRESFYESHKDDIGEWHDLMCGWYNAARTVSDCIICNVQMLADNKIDLIQWIYDRKDELIDIAIWDKGHGAPQMQSNVLNNAFEFVVIFGGNGSRSIPNGNFHGNVQNVIRLTSIGKNDFADVHAAVFPVEFPAWAIKDLCGASKSVYDPFGGSGSTLIACEQLNRKCYMSEIDPQYVRVIIDRWEKLTGEKAVLLS